MVEKQNKKISIFIENEFQGGFLQSIFLEYGYDVHVLYDGVEAYDYLRETEDFEQVVVMSYQLSGLTGIDVMEKLRSEGREFAYIFITSDKTVEMAVEAMKSGALDFIPKSSNLQVELKPMVEKVYKMQQERLERERMRVLLKEQRDLAMSQKEEIEKQKEKMTDSIRYAKRIQNAILPPQEFVKHVLYDHFVLYKPKEIVSGDFYWITQKGHYILIAAADCTGHGVPGAFMSMLGITTLNEIINKATMTDVRTDVILGQLRDYIIKSLRQTGKRGEATDGMDIALCALDMKNQKLHFSGAHNPLYFIRDGELSVIKGDKMPISIHKKSNEKFHCHEISLKKDDKFYIFSDGYVDQFGGPKGHKFQSKNFKELIVNNHEKSFENQKEILETNLADWQGDRSQLDDILVIGFNYHPDRKFEYSDDLYDWTGKHILIVENEEDNYFLLREEIEKTGALVEWAKNGKEAVDYCKAGNDANVILMDIRMEVMDGYVATQKIKEFNSDIPIIVQTAFNMSGEKEKSFKAGCDDYITKPINFKELKVTIDKYI